MTAFGATAGWDCAIVIPAKDEEARIRACLAAAAVAIAVADRPHTGIITVVNNTRDSTAGLVSDWAADNPATCLILLDCSFGTPDAGVGSARRLGLDLGWRMLRRDGVLLTTDADTRVRPDWVQQNLRELRRADLICGTVLGDPAEARALPPEIAAHGSGEWDYLNTCVALAAVLDPQQHDPEPVHHNAAGASLAVAARIYAAVGGLPVVQMGEDRAFADRLAALDYRLCYSAKAIVETSCRMTGRTDGGMAGALRSRAEEADPLADEWLEPAATFVLRHRLQGQLRAVWPDPVALRRVIGDLLGRHEAERALAPSLPRHCGTLIARLAAASPPLIWLRMHLSDCRRELPLLQRALVQTRTDRPHSIAALAEPQQALS